ncbi:MAG: RNA polymerase sigma-70 factor [Tannerellaceae bacterium]|nr:RNA polymerase sigma-70 factor [Tannerellaceae bacterium]
MKDNLTNDSFTTEPNAGINISGDVISRLREGNHAAFEKIFNLFYPKVNLFIKTLTKNDDMAEELTQQVFVNLWINREKADPGKNFSGYIYTIAKNATLRAIQQQMRFEANEFDYNEEADNRLTDDELIVKETELLVDLTVAAMPPKRRQVYRMSRHENKTNEEIANELNISRKVVEKHLRLAINELKEAMSLLLLLLFMNYFF